MRRLSEDKEAARRISTIKTGESKIKNPDKQICIITKNYYAYNRNTDPDHHDQSKNPKRKPPQHIIVRKINKKVNK